MAADQPAEARQRPAAGSADGDDSRRPEQSSQRSQSQLIERLQERKERHRQRNRVYRAGIVVIGFLIVAAGIFLSGPGVPGPGFVVILLGLGLLALEFVWAERLLERAIIWGDRAKERAERTSRGQRIVTGALTTLAVAGSVAAAILWDIPLLPV